MLCCAVEQANFKIHHCKSVNGGAQAPPHVAIPRIMGPEPSGHNNMLGVSRSKKSFMSEQMTYLTAFVPHDQLLF